MKRIKFDIVTFRNINRYICPKGYNYNNQNIDDD